MGGAVGIARQWVGARRGARRAAGDGPGRCGWGGWRGPAMARLGLGWCRVAWVAVAGRSLGWFGAVWLAAARMGSVRVGPVGRGGRRFRLGWFASMVPMTFISASEYS